MNPGVVALRKLAHMGYRFMVNGEIIKAKYNGAGKILPAQVRPLIKVVKEHKDEVLTYLRVYCPKCGGISSYLDYTGKPICISCDWDYLVQLYPGVGIKH
jgi:hypothetical protein